MNWLDEIIFLLVMWLNGFATQSKANRNWPAFAGAKRKGDKSPYSKMGEWRQERSTYLRNVQNPSRLGGWDSHCFTDCYRKQCLPSRSRYSSGNSGDVHELRKHTLCECDRDWTGRKSRNAATNRRNSYQWLKFQKTSRKPGSHQGISPVLIYTINAAV